MKRKKWLALLMGAAMLMGSVSTQAKEITIYIDGSKLVSDKQPFVQKNLTYVPVRAISEALGAKVSWSNGYVDINIDDFVCAGCQIGSNKGYTRDGDLTLEGAATVKNGTTYVPLRFVSEALGAGVDYKSGNIYIDSKSIKEKVDALKKELVDDQQRDYDNWTASDPDNVQNALYLGHGTYDAASNKWIFVLDNKKTLMRDTVIYDIATNSWSKLSDEDAIKQSVYAQYFCPGDIQRKCDYKNNALVEDFHYEYNNAYTDAVFGMTFSEQSAQYYCAAGMFRLGAKGELICVQKPMSEKADVDLNLYTYDDLGSTKSAHEPKVPDLPADLEVEKLPVTALSLKTIYHARLTAGGKTKKVVAAYQMDGQDFVALKDVQSLASGISFKQTAAGERIISFNGKSKTLTKEEYRVLFASNKLMISTKILNDLGVGVKLVYIS